MREGVHRRADRRSQRQPDAQLGVVDRGDRTGALVRAAALPAGCDEEAEVRGPFRSGVGSGDGNDPRQGLVPGGRQIGHHGLAGVHRAPAAEADQPVGTRRTGERRRLPHGLDGHVRENSVERRDDWKAGDRRQRPDAS